jgi:hypothetical protein
MNRAEERSGMNFEDWQVRVDSIDLGDLRLYHAYAFNEKTQQIIEGDTEDPDEEYVRQRFQQQLAMTLMQLEMERQMGER